MSESEGNEVGGLNDRLLAISENRTSADVKPHDLTRAAIAQMTQAAERGEEIALKTDLSVGGLQKAPRGVWLTAELENYKRSMGITEVTEPTEEEIRKQILLPTADQLGSFKEPIREWEPVSGPPKLPHQKTRQSLPDEQDDPREPPEIDRRWYNTSQYLEMFEKEKVYTKPAKEFKLEEGENPVKVCQEWVENNNNKEGPVILNYKDCVVRTSVSALKEPNVGGGGRGSFRGRGELSRSRGGGGQQEMSAPRSYQVSERRDRRQRSNSRDRSGRGSRDRRDGGSRGDRGDRSQKSSSRDSRRHRSPSPYYRRRRSPSPHYRRRSPSPHYRRRRSPSPYSRRRGSPQLSPHSSRKAYRSRSRDRSSRDSRDRKDGGSRGYRL